MAKASKPILQGQALQDYLSRCQRYWYDYKNHEYWEDEPHPLGIGLEDRRAALVEQLQAFRFIPQTPDELERLYWLWQDLGASQSAWDLLKSRQETVLAPLADDFEQNQQRLRLDLCELDALWQLDRERGKSRLGEIFGRLLALPEPAEDNQKYDVYSFWQRLEFWSMNFQDWSIYQHSLHAQHALRRKIPTRCQKLRFNEAVDTLLDCARYAQHVEDKATLDRYLDELIEQARTAGDEVQHEHWMNLCAALLHLNPAYIEKALHVCNIQLERHESPPAHPTCQVERRVQAARWQARAKAGQGELEQALQWAKQGHFKLVSDGDYDSFGNEYVDWLLQAGRLAEAAELAFSALLARRHPLAARAWQLALEQVDANPLPWWHWILFFGQIDPVLQKEHGCAETPAPLPIFSHLRQAEELAPASPMTSLLLGRYYTLQRDWQQALPRLEYAAFALPQYADDEHIGLLWVARFMQLTDQQLALCNIPPCEGGNWCLEAGLTLRGDDGLLAKHCSPARLQNRDGLRQYFACKYYEMGLKRYRAFFKSAAGRYADAGLLGYSALCNNLGAILRAQERFKKARKLHQEGHTCYPLALHQSNLFFCAKGLNDRRALLLAAERLWYHVQEKGFEYHSYNLANYAYDTAWTLNQQGRREEISLWLERLQLWEQQRQASEQENNPCRGDYLHALMALLVFHVNNDREQSNRLLRSHLDEVQRLSAEQSGNQPLGLTLRYSATLMEYCSETRDDLSTAKHLYFRALKHLPHWHGIDIKRAQKGLTRCDKQARNWENR